MYKGLSIDKFGDVLKVWAYQIMRSLQIFKEIMDFELKNNLVSNKKKQRLLR